MPAPHDPPRSISPAGRAEPSHSDPDTGHATPHPAQTTGGEVFRTVADLPPMSPGRYALGDEIARGGMGVVYHATDTAFGREVAVKVLQTKFGTASGAAHRFSDEARITAQLQHPAIPPVHDVGTLPDGRPFLAMKLIKGDTLDELLAARPDPSADRGRFTAVFEQVCQAVAYAHAHGVIHRDLKPANVMVGNYGEVQVMDWGLAKVLSADGRASNDSDPNETVSATEIQSLRDADGTFTQAGSVLGTPAFMPPEQAVGALGKIGARSDVFGLGAVLAVILTGKPPFASGSAETTRVKAAQGKVDECFTRLDACGADPELVALAKQCLAPAPADRPADAGAVAKAVAVLRQAADERARLAELERVKAEGEKLAAELSAAEQRKRRRVQLALAVATCLVLLGFGAVAVGWRDNARLEDAYSKEAAARQDQSTQRERAESLVTEKDALLLDKESLLYANRMLQAGQAWSWGYSSRVEQLLGECPDKLRGWEWHYLRRQCHLELLTMSKHDDYAFVVAVSPDGTLIASGGMDSTTKLWEAATGKLVCSLPQSKRMVGGVAFSPDGKWLATACGDFEEAGVVQVWDRASNPPKLMTAFDSPPGNPRGLAFNADSSLLAVSTSYSSEAQVRVRDWRAGREVFRLDDPVPGYDGLAFHPTDKDCLAVGVGNPDVEVPRQPGSVHFWDVTHKKRLHHVLGGHDDGILGVAFSADGRSLVSAGRDSVAKIWDVETGRERTTLRGHQRMIYRAVFSPDGTRVATASDDSMVRVWDAKSGKPLFAIRGSLGPVWSLAYLADGQRLISASEDGQLKVWDATAGGEARTLVGEKDRPALGVAYGPGDLVVAGGIDGKLRLWRTSSRQPTRVIDAHDDQITQITFSADGRWLATASHDRTFKVWDVETWQLRFPAKVGAERLRSVAVDPKGRWLATGGADGVVKLWDASSGQFVRSLQPHRGQVRSVAFSPDGTTLASAGEDHLVKIWDLNESKEIASREEQTTTAPGVLFSPDGRVLVSTCGSGLIYLRDPRTGEPRHTLRGATSTVSGIAINPDGTRLASVGLDNQVKLWNLSSGQEVFNLSLPSLSLGALAFSRDGQRLVAGSDDGTFTEWEASAR